MPFPSKRTVLASLACVVLAGVADAQPYDPAYPPMGRRPVRGFGLNCETMSPGTLFAPPAPFFCPLPGRRPLGAPCYCNAPAMYGNEDWEGRVVP
jgi:hypothetical protein